MTATVTKLHASPAERMLALFGGARCNGYDPATMVADASGKVKPTAHKWTRKPSIALWQQHIDGVVGIGVIPPGSDDRVMFAVIDVDVYDVDCVSLAGRIRDLRLPLVPTMTKSRGVHLNAFVGEPVDAALMERALCRLAARLGLRLKDEGGATEVITTQNIWAPHLGGDKLAGVKLTGAQMTLAEFLRTAEDARLSPAALAALASAEPVAATVSSADAQRRLEQGCAAVAKAKTGERNEVLYREAFALGQLVGAEALDEATVRDRLASAGAAAGLDAAEIADTVGRAVEKGKRSPTDGLPKNAPVIVRGRVVRSDTTTWFLTLEGPAGEVEVEVRQAANLMRYQRFVDLCAARHLYLPHLKQATWAEIVRSASSTWIVEDAPQNTSRSATFAELLDEFLTNRARGERREDILSRRPWENEELRRHEFRVGDLVSFLAREGLKTERAEVWEWVRRLGGGKVGKDGVVTLKGKSVRLWWVPSQGMQPAEPLDVPATKEVEV